MVKLRRKIENNIKTIEYADNLIPVIFKCGDCGCTIRRLEDTDSYILMATSKEVETGNKKICSYCYRLQQYRGIE